MQYAKTVVIIKRNTKNTTLSKQFQNQIKIVERGKIYTIHTQIHDCTPFWDGTDT